MASVVDIKFVDESENFDFEKSGKSSRPRRENWSSDPLTMGRAAMGTNLKIVARSLK